MAAKKPSTSRRAPFDFSKIDAALPDSVARLAHTAPRAKPSAAVKTNLMARIRGEAKRAPVEPGWRFESANDTAGWITLPFPGVRIKPLSSDEKRDVIQMLIEIAPGARFPDHDHTVGDEGIVLSGDVYTGGRLMRAGDYYHASAGTHHADIVSPSGCVAMVATTVTAWKRFQAEMAGMDAR